MQFHKSIYKQRIYLLAALCVVLLHLSAFFSVSHSFFLYLQLLLYGGCCFFFLLPNYAIAFIERVKRATN